VLTVQVQILVEQNKSAVEWSKGPTERRRSTVEWSKGPTERRRSTVEWSKGPTERRNSTAERKKSIVEQRKARSLVVPVLNIVIEGVTLDMLSRQLDSSTRILCTRFCLQHPQFEGNTHHTSKSSLHYLVRY